MLFKKKISRCWRTVVSKRSKINPSPIFILGKEKSGTTAIAALLAEYTASSSTLDIPAIWGDKETKIYSGKTSFTDFVQHNKYEFSKDIIKEPGLTFLYPKIKAVFPQATFVMIIRDPRDNTRSILNRLNLPGNLEQLPPEVIIPSNWEVVLNSKWIGARGNNYIEMLADRWNRSVDVYLNYSKEMFLIRYENFLKDKKKAIEELANRLELPGTNDISDKVDIQYQPRGNRGISWEEFFGPENLRRIEWICGSRMTQFGYQPVLETSLG